MTQGNFCMGILLASGVNPNAPRDIPMVLKNKLNTLRQFHKINNLQSMRIDVAPG